MLRIGSCLLVLLLVAGKIQAEESAEVGVESVNIRQANQNAVVCLTTAWYPRVYDQVETENRLLRELLRQGVLMAVREELGLATRDETLGEPFPAKAKKVSDGSSRDLEPLNLWFEITTQGSWEARLFGAGTTYDEPIWDHSNNVKFKKRTIYGEFAKQVLDLAGEIAESLRTVGFKGDGVKANAENVPGVEIDELLGQMNFVSQYAAVRAAHHAIGDRGVSVEWLGVLVRGYAHLAMLTDHTWASHSEVFGARSLIYSERLMKLGKADEFAQWNRAYALAIIGMHGAASDQVADLGKLIELKKGKKFEPPSWTALIQPVVYFEHAKLKGISDTAPELGELAAYLQWDLYTCYRHGRWVYDQGLTAMAACPEAYGIYSFMSNWGLMRIDRTGSHEGLQAFGSMLPARVARISDLPESVKLLTASQGGFFSRLLGVEPDPVLNGRPFKISQEFMKVTAEETTASECSWAILGQLIAEEQFMQAANMLAVAGNAVEYSKADLVNQLLPLVEGHRYAAYIESFKFSMSEELQRKESLGNLVVVDPKGNMWPLFGRIWSVPTADGRKGKFYSWRAVWARNFTLPGMIESYYGSLPAWSRDSIGREYRELFARDFGEISPFSPSAGRVRLETGEKFSDDQLAIWEAGLQKDDPIVWIRLGDQYAKIDQLDAAKNAYQRSLEIGPSMNATRKLANLHYKAGDKDAWQKTLESYLELEDLSLNHASIHSQIARENLRKRDWVRAEPHALEAAGTYSNWGLMLASFVYEGKQDWEQSEHYVSAAARAYPSSSGAEWYFWCRRTGRGDIEAAREVAKQYIEVASQKASSGSIHRVFAYRVLEGETEAGLADLDKQLTGRTGSEGRWDLMRRCFYLLVACGDIKNEQRKAEVLKQARTLISIKFNKKNDKWADNLNGLCDIFAGEEPDKAFFEKFDDWLATANEGYRTNYWFFLGAALDQQGKFELADEYLRMSAFSPGAPVTYSTALAGDRLVKRHGLDRGGLPEKYAEIEAKHAAEAEAKSEEEADAESEVGADDQSI